MLRLLRRRSAAGSICAGRIRASAQVLTVLHGERAILLDARRGRYFGLDGVGAEIWQALQDRGNGQAARCGAGLTVSELAAYLEQHYDAPLEQLERDAREFVQRLSRARLVEAA